MFQEIPWQAPLEIFAQFAGMRGAIFLDSAKEHAQCGRYSYIAIDPFQVFSGKNGQFHCHHRELHGDPFALLAEEIAKFSVAHTTTFEKALPPFQGGVAGFFSYELNQYIENVPRARVDDLQFPDLALGFYDLVLAFDHLSQQAWIISTGDPETGAARERRAAARMRWLLGLIQTYQPLSPLMAFAFDPSVIRSHFTREQYVRAVLRVKEAIFAGDIFQANISRRLDAFLPYGHSVFDLYRCLREINPAPFAAFVNLADTMIASASPERFLKMQHQHVEARPIKGTRPRGKNHKEDARLSHELLSSQKERAENTMIVDLMRNDFSRVCEEHSILVPALCQLESHPSVHHLVSQVTGQLRAEFGPIDLLRATFPGGSVTGAPKIRAMEIIADIEPVVRGPYCGSIGYISWQGALDLSITIRTFVARKNVLTFQTGGAVVADSDPVAEYEETKNKAAALVAALSGEAVLL